MLSLDHNATTQPSPEVVAAMVEMLTEFWHNPSSVHRAGQAARQRVELARQSVANLIRAKPRDVVFTSSGTEALDLAIRGFFAAAKGAKTFITSKVEHAAIRDIAEDWERRGAAGDTSVPRVTWLPVTREGVVDVAAFPNGYPHAPRGDQTPRGAWGYPALVCVQWANNETGAIQPIAAISKLCRASGATLLVDGTQWVGKEPTDVSVVDGVANPFDLLAFAPHKFHGPKGVGVLWIRQGTAIRPQMLGTQELSRRGGTENTPAIVGAGVAAEQAIEWLSNPQLRRDCASLRDMFEQRVLELVQGSVINSPRDNAKRLWNTTNIAFPHLEAEALLLLLSEKGIAASAGAACSSGSLEPSPVLLAMGIEEHLAHGSLRFSTCKDTTKDELNHTANVIAECVKQLTKSWK
ncbi:MAG: cysteine desulfurase family protein [Phycisphaerales bacterium]